MKIMPLEYDTRYRLGTRTFIYTFFHYGWLLTAIGITLFYLSWLMAYGILRPFSDGFLAQHPGWYVDTTLLAYWIFLVGISFVFVGILRAWVMYRQHTFLVDKHAFHLRRGLFRTRETRIPYAQISNVEIERPYHYRILGLAQLDVTISSGDRDTGRSAESRAFLIPIIDAKLAHALSYHIIRHGSNHAVVDDEDNEDDEYEDDQYDEVEDDDGVESDVEVLGANTDFTNDEEVEAKQYRVYKK